MKAFVIIVLAVVYVLSPIDFIPDVAPIIGWLDDCGVIGYAYSALKAMKQQAPHQPAKSISR